MTCWAPYDVTLRHGEHRRLAVIRISSERAEPVYVLEQTPRRVVSALDAVNAQTAFILAVLKAGADVDATNNRSKTALLLALSQLKE